MTSYQDSEEYKRKIIQTEEIKKVLVKWNPLGARSVEIKDLNDYETEANDIMYHISIPFQFSKKGSPEARVEKIVKEVLNEAFRLWLTDEECSAPSMKVMKIIESK